MIVGNLNYHKSQVGMAEKRTSWCHITVYRSTYRVVTDSFKWKDYQLPESNQETRFYYVGILYLSMSHEANFSSCSVTMQ